MSQHEAIFLVTTVQLSLNKKLPPELVIDASGFTSTAGWTDPQLVPRVYVSPPTDGIQEYDFVAIPPTGVATEQLSEIRAVEVLRNIPEWFRGVRVCASSNAVVGRLEERRSGASTPTGHTRMVITATGHSDVLSFDEAFQNALHAVEDKVTKNPDYLLVVTVAEIRGELGGFDGRTRLLVTLKTEV